MKYLLALLIAFALCFPVFAGDCNCTVTGVCTCGPDCQCQQTVTVDDGTVTAWYVTEDLLCCPDLPNIAYSKSKKDWVKYDKVIDWSPPSQPVTFQPIFFQAPPPPRFFGGGGCAGGRCRS